MFKKLGQKIISHYEKQASCDCTPTTDLKGVKDTGCCKGSEKKSEVSSRKSCCSDGNNGSKCC